MNVKASTMAGRRMGKLSLCDDCRGLRVYNSRAHYCTDGLPYYFVVVFQVVNEHIYCIFALYTCMSMCCKHYYTIEYYCACYSHVPDTTVMRFLCMYKYRYKHSNVVVEISHCGGQNWPLVSLVSVTMLVAWSAKCPMVSQRVTTTDGRPCPKSSKQGTQPAS